MGEQSIKSQTKRRKKTQRSGKRSKTLRNASLIFAVAAAFAGTSYVVYAGQFKDKFLESTSINGVDVSDMTVDEACQALQDTVTGYEITVTFRGNTKETIKGEDISFTFDSKDRVEDLLQSQDEFGWLAAKIGHKTGYTVESTYSLDEDQLESVVFSFPELQEENCKAPEDAHMTLTEGNTFEIVREEQGNTINRDVLMESLVNAITRGETSLEYNVIDGGYLEPDVLSDNEDLNLQVTDLNGYLATSVTYTTHTGTYTLDRNTTKDWLSVSDEDPDYYYIDSDVISQKCAEYIASLASLDDSAANSFRFHSTAKGEVSVPRYGCGHAIDQAAEHEALFNNIMTRVSDTREPAYAYNNPDPAIGGTYVEVDIYGQMVYVYQNGQLVIESPCVTGMDGVKNTTSGLFSIYNKVAGRTLYGRDYATWVNYWMPFNGGIGLHDAYWRNKFGGNIYKTAGSHGCVNLPPAVAAQLFNIVSVGTQVIVYRA